MKRYSTCLKQAVSGKCSPANTLQNQPFTDATKCGKRQKSSTDCSERPAVQTRHKQLCTLIQRSGWQKGGRLVSKAGKFKSSKITAPCSEAGQIQDFEIGNGGENDHKAVKAIVHKIPKKVYVTADKGFDSKKLRRKIRQNGSMPLIPRRQRENQPVRRTPKPHIYKSRWRMEQSFSRTDQFRKLNVRTERDPYSYKQYWYLGLTWIELKKLTG